MLIPKFNNKSVDLALVPVHFVSSSPTVSELQNDFKNDLKYIRTVSSKTNRFETISIYSENMTIF